jgi:hypothetical protein
MNVVIPPLVFYLVGAVLVVAGAIRALTLGRRNPAREIADDDPFRTRARRRHMTFGIVWIAMGLFLIISTAGVLRSKWGAHDGDARAEPQRPEPNQGSSSPSSASSPVIRLDPGRPTTLEPPAKP